MRQRHAGRGPAAKRLVVLFMENHSRPQIVGAPTAPYQTALAANCAQDVNMWAISHPSLPNYLALHSGVFTPDVPRLRAQPGGACMSKDDNLFHQVQTAGLTWRNYAEDMTSACQLQPATACTPPGTTRPSTSPTSRCRDGPARPAARRNDVIMGDVGTQTGRFYDDLRAGTLPTYTFISPNLINDAHSSSIAAGDAYLSKLIPIITSGPNYQAGDTDIFITYDEGAGKDKANDEDCTNQARDLAGQQPSCNIPFIVVAPYVAERHGVDAVLHAVLRDADGRGPARPAAPRARRRRGHPRPDRGVQPVAGRPGRHELAVAGDPALVPDRLVGLVDLAVGAEHQEPVEARGRTSGRG